MYKRNAQGWSKHFDFILFDLISIQLAFVLSVYLRLHSWAYDLPLYRTLGVVLLIVDVLVILLFNSFHNVVSRGFVVEIKETIKHCFYVLAIDSIYLFAVQAGDEYSRIVLSLTFAFHVVLGYLIRITWKAFIKKSNIVVGNKKNIILVADNDNAQRILSRLTDNEVADYNIIGVVLTEHSDMDTISGYSIVADIEDAADYIVREWIDSVYIDASLSNEKVTKLMDDCTLMGIPTHYHVPNMSRDGVKRFSEKMGGTTVLTSSINYITPIQAFIKRCFDIFAGIIGSIIAVIVILIIGPIIKKKSPGPILFTQNRVGKNGRIFKMYKIRSMCIDADNIKQDLQEQNRVKDGLMFKLDFDPRIIGNTILPDGTKKTGIGEFIRKTSLDELPQFFNVLEGTMSCIGTRPPTLDEYQNYKYHHRARLAIKPGITGLWQVSGRSEITDFEEVVRLDMEYITNWSYGLDIKILFKTIAVIFSHKGAM